MAACPSHSVLFIMKNLSQEYNGMARWIATLLVVNRMNARDGKHSRIIWLNWRIYARHCEYVCACEYVCEYVVLLRVIKLIN